MPGTDDLTSVRIGATFIAAIPPNGNALEVFDADGARTVVINAAGALVSALVASDITTADDVLLSFGTGEDARLSWDTTDANANELLLQMPAGGATNVPVLAIGQSIESVDLGLYNGVTEPRVAIFGVGAVATAPVLEFRKARGTIASPTVVTSGDDMGSIDFYGAVAAGEYVRGARILAEMTGTVATTRGPGVLTFLTATDAAPSVLTAALTLGAAQQATIGGALTVTGTSTFNGNLILPANTDLTFTGTTGTNDIVLTNALADALSITDGSADILVVDTSTTGNVLTITAAVTATSLRLSGTTTALGLGAAESVTVSGGVATITKAHVILAGEGATTDTVDSISMAGQAAGDIIVIRAIGGYTLTFDNSGTMLLGAGTRALTAGGILVFLATSTTVWTELLFLTAAS